MFQRTLAVIAITVFGISILSAEVINPADYFPANKGNKWIYSGENLFKKNHNKYSIEFGIDAAQKDPEGILYNCYRISPQKSYSNDGPESYLVKADDIIDFDSGLPLLKRNFEIDREYTVGNGNKFRVVFSGGPATIGDYKLARIIKTLTCEQAGGRTLVRTFGIRLGIVQVEVFDSIKDYKAGKIHYREVLTSSSIH